MKDVSKCRVCGGDVVEKVVRKLDPKLSFPVIGPGSGRQLFYDVHEGFYCKECGLKYEFVRGQIPA